MLWHSIYKEVGSETNPDYKYKHIRNIQAFMFEFISRYIFKLVRESVLDKEYATYYFTEDKYDEYILIHSFDPRVILPMHDTLAQVFRYKCSICEIGLTLLEPTNSEILEIFESKHIEGIDFLDRIDVSRWHFCLKWLDFVKAELEANHPVVRELSKALFVYKIDDKYLKFDSAFKAKEYISDKYADILIYKNV